MSGTQAEGTDTPLEEIREIIKSGKKVRVIDLFCGGGGMSYGLAQALEDIAAEFDRDIGDVIQLIAVNHDADAIATHKENHPWAEHHNVDLQEKEPEEIVDRTKTVHLLIACPDCTFFSPARGGGRKDRDKRMLPFQVHRWVEVLQDVKNVLFENVPNFRNWGPLDEDDKPIKDKKGEYFDLFIKKLTLEGLQVEHKVLNCANYGDATARKRLFIIGRRDSGVEWPEQTHSENGDVPGTEEWRTAEEIIDWSNTGGSIFSRFIDSPRKQPLSQNTNQRIAEGIRRHCADLLTPFADFIETLGKEDMYDLVDRAVPIDYADVAAQVLDEPFLVDHSANTSLHNSASLLLGQQSNYNVRDVQTDTVPTISKRGNHQFYSPFLVKFWRNSVSQSLSSPLGTITAQGRHYGISNTTAYLLRQQSGGTPASVEKPVPTIAKGGAIGLTEVSSPPLVMPRNQKCGGLHSNSLYEPETQPLHTVTAQNTDGYLTTPALYRFSRDGETAGNSVTKSSLIRYSFSGATLDIDEPLPTILTEKGGVFAHSEPYLCPMYSSRKTQRPRTRRVDRPLMTVPSSKSPAGVSMPDWAFLVDYHGESTTASVDSPIGALESKERYALCIPELYPFGFDVKYRMLQPKELAAAQGFPNDYEFHGNKSDVTAQIGNAVPVQTAKSLCKAALVGSQPTIDSFIDHTSTGESSSASSA
jgi:DNA (cytosine-5)-methyltransferase 1